MKKSIVLILLIFLGSCQSNAQVTHYTIYSSADDDGNIAAINPTVKTSWGPMLFLIELFIWNRINKMPQVLEELAEAKSFIKQLNERIDEMEEKINGTSKDTNPPQ